MNGRTAAIRTGGLLVALATIALPLEAEIYQFSQAVIQVHCSDADGSAHPRRVEAIQPIVGDVAAGVEVWPMFALYESLPPGDGGGEVGGGEAGSAARIRKMAVEIVQTKADGSQRQVARFRRPMLRDGSAFGARRVATRLERGDLLHWRLAFQGSSELPEGACFLTLVGFGQDEERLAAAASQARDR